MQLAIRIVVWTFAAAYLGLHFLLLIGSSLFGGPDEPGSQMSFEEFHIRSASRQWFRDDVDSFIIALVFSISASITVTLLTMKKKNTKQLLPFVLAKTVVI